MNKKKAKGESSEKRMTRSLRKRQVEMDKKKEEAIKRQRNSDTANGNVIGPNDIIVHGTGNVVKVESETDSTSVTVKEEVDSYISSEMESTGFHGDIIKSEIEDTFVVVKEEFNISSSDDEDSYEENTIVEIKPLFHVSNKMTQETAQVLPESVLSIDHEKEARDSEISSESSYEEIPEDQLESTSRSNTDQGKVESETLKTIPTDLPNHEVLAADLINEPEIANAIAEEPQENAEMETIKEVLHKMKTEMENLQEILKKNESETATLREIIKGSASEKQRYVKECDAQLSQKNAFIQELLDEAQSRKELLEEKEKEINEVKETVKESAFRKDEAERSLKGKDDEINKLKTVLQENEEKIKNLNETARQHIARKDQALHTLKEEILEMKESFIETATEKEKTLQSLKEKDDEINNLKALLDESNKNVDNVMKIIDTRNYENASLSELVNEYKDNTNKAVQIVEERDKEIETLKLCLEKARSRQSNAFSELSNEVWEAIPKKLDTALDYTTTVNKTGELSSLLEQQKNICLFDEVLQTFIRHGNKGGQGHIVWSSKMPTLLKCRLICKSWKKSVDRVLGQHPSHFALCESGLSLKIFKRYCSPCPVLFRLSKDTLGMQKIPSNILENFKMQQQHNPYYNPLPSRHFMIKINSDSLINILSPGNWNKFHDSISTYLEAFGRQVCYFTVNISGKHFSQSDLILMYMCLCNWLQLLPNVQSLAFGIHHTGFLQEIQSQIEKLHYPELPDLITFQSETETDNLFVHHFLKKNPHVQRLRFNASKDVTKILEVDLPHLQELSTFIKNPGFLKDDLLPWNVKRLMFIVSDEVTCTPLQLQNSLMGTLHLNENTLEYLKLVLPSFDMFGGQLVLPNLKHFHIKLNRSWMNNLRWHHILRGLNSLDNLTLDLTMITSTYKYFTLTYNEKLTFWNYINTFHEARYWLNFPHLKTVYMSIKFGGREIMKSDEYSVKRPEMPVVIFNVVCVGERVHFL